MTAESSGAEASDPTGAHPGRRVTLAELDHRLGATPSAPSLAEFWNLSREAHALRYRNRVADTPFINRSTALWATLVVDPEIALATAEGGLSARPLWDKLTISSPNHEAIAAPEGPSGTEMPSAWSAEVAATIQVDATLAEALLAHLSAIPEPQPVRALDVTAAILEAVQAQPGGLLPSRLQQLSVDVSQCLDALQRLMNGGEYGFSGSVRSTIAAQGSDQRVTAGELATKLALKGQYIGPDMRITFDEGAGDRLTGREWLARVRRLYETNEVLTTRGIIDGELVIRALVFLVPALRRGLPAKPEVNDWLESIQPTPASRTRTTPSADEPAKVDLLGRQTLARAFVSFLDQINAQGDVSFLAHLDAPWGEGKSSLLGFIGDEANCSYRIVKVNAWREQRVGAQWWTLYRALQQAHRDSQHGVFRRARNLLDNLVDVVVVRWDRVWPVLITAVVVFSALWLAARQFTSLFAKFEFATIATILSLTGAAFVAVSGLYRFLAPTSARGARALLETSLNPMDEVQSLFSRLLRRSREPVLFLIDDLDRCEPSYVVQFLEVVHTLVRDAPRSKPSGDRGTFSRGVRHILLAMEDGWRSLLRRPKPSITGGRGPGLYGVVAADGKWLRRCYEQHYSSMSDIDDTGKPLGYAFLDKFFQQRIRMPDVEPRLKKRYYEDLLAAGEVPRSGGLPDHKDDERAAAIRSRLPGVKGFEGASQLTREINAIANDELATSLRGEVVDKMVESESREQLIHELAPFVDLLDANPRSLRLFVNDVSLMATLRIIEGSPPDLASLALWAIVERRWPELADHLRVHPDDIAAINQAKPEPEPPHPAGELVGGPQPAAPPTLPLPMVMLIHSGAVRAVLIESPWGAMDPQRIRACTGAGGVPD